MIASRIHDLVKLHARSSPDAPALVAPRRAPLVYERLWRHILETAAALRAVGVADGSRVAIVLPDGPEMAVAFLSVSAVATAAPINSACQFGEFDGYFEDLRISHLLTNEPAGSPVVRAAHARGVPILRLDVDIDRPAGSIRLVDQSSRSVLLEPTAARSDVAIVLTTSGTTSRAKVVALTHDQVSASAQNIAASLNLVPADRCLDVMPLFHVHGLIGGLLASLAGGASVICPPRFDAPRFFEWLDELAPTWYSAVPTMHQAILARAAAHRDVTARRHLRFIRSSSAALPEPVRLALEQELNAPVIEAYGMTEASQQIACNPLPPGHRKPGSVGVPVGTQVRILDPQCAPVPPGEIGEIAIRGASVITSYERGASAGDESFVDGWLKTGDLGYLDEDGYLFLTGRLKEIVNRGGEKISPREVDEALLEHPSVAQAAAFGMHHPTLGQDVAAAVVLRPGATTSELALREWTAGRLAPFKVPARLVFLDKIPTGPTGKVQRALLAEQIGIHAADVSPPEARPAFVPPSGNIEESLAALWHEILRVDGIGRHDHFFHLGGDSVLGARLLATIVNDLGGELSFVSLFEHPTLGEMAAAVQRAIADARRERRPPPMAAKAENPQPASPSPVSFGQERLWFLDQWQPGSSVFNSSIRLRLTGRLHVEALQQALERIVDRHQTLRASFPAADGRPLLRIAPALAVQIVLVDLGTLRSADQRAEVSRLMLNEIERPFDLAEGPLIRAALWRLGNEEHVLLIVVHHIVFDGWSQSVFLRELGHFYDQIAAGRPATLPPLPLQHADFARRETASIDIIDRDLAFWTTQLAGMRLAELPSDGPRPDMVDVRGGVQTDRLPPALARAIVTLSRREGATPFMTMVAAFAILLSRLTGVRDIIVGTPVAGRTGSASEDLIGFFVKTLILRIDVSGRPSFRELVRRARRVTLDALDHQDVPLQRLAGAVNPERFLNRNPLYDVIINFRNIPDDRLELAGLEVEMIDRPNPPCEVALSVEIATEGETFVVRMAYQRALFSEQRVASWLAQYAELLQQVVAAPDTSIDDSPLSAPASGSAPASSLLTVMSEAERRKLLIDWNQTHAEYPAHLCLHELVEAQSVRTPEATAIVSDNGVITYAALNARANRVARMLRSRGVGPDVIVGVCLDRSIDLIVVLLAVLKAGGAYLPLDPGHPRARLKTMIEEAAAPFVVTEFRYGDRIVGDSTEIICLDKLAPQGLDEPDADLPNVVSPAHLAFVMFTSGSTGKPKGVMIPHRGICNHIWWLQSAFPMTGRDRVLQQAPLSFDFSVWECFAPLNAGATLVLGPVSDQLDPAERIDLIVRHGVTVLHFVPPLLGPFLDEPTVTRCTTVRLVLCGGAPLTPALRDRFFECFETAVLVNSYGPTEACIDTVSETCDRSDRSRIVAIGRPIANTSVYVLGPQLELLPIGAVGELYIGGAGLARGYVNRPELTAERFIRNPFSADAESRLYRTGDRVRYLPDGRLVFLGRVDDQVKIRGIRVELGEIEAAISAHPAVQQAVVIARHAADHDADLIAYYVSRDAELSATALRRFLRETLPESLVPSGLVRLDGLPLTSTGKIDRHALPAWTPDRDVAKRFTPPRTPLEKLLARIWSEVLQVTPVGIHDDFFAMGGHSLHATQVVSRINRELGRAVAVRQIFECLTIDALARAIEDPSPDRLTSAPRQAL